MKFWKSILLRAAFQSFRIALSFLPRRLCLALGRGLGRGLYRLDRNHRTLALANLDSAMGRDLSPSERKETAAGAFSHFGEFVLELLKLSTLSTERIRSLITLHGREHLDDALSQGRGAILFSAHIGNWEIAPAELCRFGRLHVIARPLDDPWFESRLLAFRARIGGRVISKTDAVRPVLRALRNNEMVAILADQNVLRTEAVFVKFFDRLTATTPSPALFHLRTGAPLLPVFCTRTRDRRYRIDIGPAVKIQPEAEASANVLKIMELCSKIIEMHIRSQPSQWLWFHNRWKTQPPDETPVREPHEI